MNSPLTRKLLTALICGGILIATAPAAHADRDDHDDRDHRRWQHEKRHYKKHRDWDGRTVYRERVIIRERPRHYREREVHHHYYQQPMPSYGYGYSRSPALVIGVNIPPLIIPLN
jgi:hypothetical protein